MQTINTQLQRIEQIQPRYGIFEVHANNSKRRAGKPVEYVDAFGSLYPDNCVHIHTNKLQVTDFTSLRQMREYLESMGDCRIVWLAGPLASQIDEEMI